jgi:GNAT superfamily N-acetyltransferase
MLLRRASYKRDKNEIVKLIEVVGESFVPKISERVGAEGYCRYLFGLNHDYIKSTRGKDCPLPRDPAVFVVEENGRIIGLAACFGYYLPYDGAYLVCCMVDGRYRNLGIGKRLVKARTEYLESLSVSCINVTTWSNNLASRSALEKSGFILSNIVPDERGPGIHGLLYKKFINRNSMKKMFSWNLGMRFKNSLSAVSSR